MNVDEALKILKEKLIKSSPEKHEQCQSHPYFYLSGHNKDALPAWLHFGFPYLILVFEGGMDVLSQQKLCLKRGDFALLRNMDEAALAGMKIKQHITGVIIRFESPDEQHFDVIGSQNNAVFSGEICPLLCHCVTQFVEWTPQIPEHLWNFRRSEIIHLISYLKGPRTSFRDTVLTILADEKNQCASLDYLSQKLFMSKSTFVRKLRKEGTSLQNLKDDVRLEKGHSLLRNTKLPLSMIANECGYRTQSKFSQRFKKRFNVTPSAFRKSVQARYDKASAYKQTHVN